MSFVHTPQTTFLRTARNGSLRVSSPVTVALLSVLCMVALAVAFLSGQAVAERSSVQTVRYVCSGEEVAVTSSKRRFPHSLFIDCLRQDK